MKGENISKSMFLKHFSWRFPAGFKNNQGSTHSYSHKYSVSLMYGIQN
jgi:hypothetical protein